jgi:hypothetical protein
MKVLDFSAGKVSFAQPDAGSVDRNLVDSGRSRPKLCWQHEWVSHIWNQPIDGSSPIQVTNFKADSILNFFWSHDGKQLVISRDVTNTDIVLIKDFR